MRTRLILPVALLLAAAVDAQSPALQIMRATAHLNGVFSPRGFFNITVRLYSLTGLNAAKFDLKKSQITLDFKPGIEITQAQIQRVMVDAGYKPGPVRIESLAADQVRETGPGWVKMKHPTSGNAFLRWLQLNF
jgi:hypothetical protein